MDFDWDADNLCNLCKVGQYRALDSFLGADKFLRMTSPPGGAGGKSSHRCSIVANTLDASQHLPPVAVSNTPATILDGGGEAADDLLTPAAGLLKKRGETTHDLPKM